MWLVEGQEVGEELSVQGGQPQVIHASLPQGLKNVDAAKLKSHDVIQYRDADEVDRGKVLGTNWICYQKIKEGKSFVKGNIKIMLRQTFWIICNIGYLNQNIM